MSGVLQRDEFSEQFDGAEAAGVRGKRAEQQDAALVSWWVCAIADGLGGHPRGAEASYAALAALERAVDGPCDAAGLAAAIDTADAAVKELATGLRDNPGTTIVALAVAPDAGSMVGTWCGDSRAWLLAPGSDRLVQITRDHADDQGLSSCLGEHGADFGVVPETFTVMAGHGHRVLLTTDGVHGFLADPAREMAVLLGAGLLHLVSETASRGTDNATAVLIDVDRFIASATGAAPR